ncbi:MAG: hypothetical protein LBP59_07665 [Planctomycetaceae bacterium]|nr:hypothetical protein [Planctomycetaceae bacterium]
MRLYSTAGERGFDLNSLFVCLAAKCRRDARDPLVSPDFQDRRHLAWVHSDSQARCPRSFSETVAFLNFFCYKKN